MSCPLAAAVRSRTLVAALVSVALLHAIAATAHASTLTLVGGKLTFTAADGVENAVDIDETAPATVEIRTPNDAADATPPGCSDISAGSDRTGHECGGVTSIEVQLLDMDDSLDGRSLLTIPLTAGGGAGGDTLTSGGGDDELTGGDGEDTIFAEAGDDSVNGGAGDDGLFGGLGNDTVDGGPGDDFPVLGGPDDDTVHGGEGDDTVAGDCGEPCAGNGMARSSALVIEEGDDILEGGPGSDDLLGGGGDDIENGGPGDDRFGTLALPFFLSSMEDLGNDTFNGGDGVDSIGYPTQQYDEGSGTFIRVDVRVSLDGVANDGQLDENDNVMPDVEDVRLEPENPFMVGPPPIIVSTRSTQAAETNTGRGDLIGSDGLNGLTGTDGNDFIDGKAGNDFLNGMEGNDTIEARDGYADRVSCGAGEDVANVDTLDIVGDCETVNVEDRGNANDIPEDAPPAVAWTAPAEGVELGADGAALAASAADDNGVAQVVFLAGNRIICADTTAPYGCDFKPTGTDVGKLALIAAAIDGAGQMATALRQVTVDRFRPSKLTARTSPKKDTKGPRKFTTRGALTPPEGVTAEQGCTGRVSVQIKAGKRTISTRRARLKDDCSYRSKVKLTLPRRFGSAKRLKIRSRFLGNETLKRRKAPREKVRVR